jgi:site-specific recombinase XerD
MTVSTCWDSLTAQQQPAGPLQLHIDWFARRLAEQGYAPFTAREKLRLVTQLSQWLQDRQLGAEALDESCIDQFLQYRQQQGRMPRHNRDTLRTFLTELRDARLLPTPAHPTGLLDELASAFDNYLVDGRGLALTTRQRYLGIVRCFLQGRFGTDPLLLHEVSIHDVTQFLLRQSAVLSPRSAQNIVSALRTFCRFLLHRGEIAVDLAAAIPSVADWRFATVPKAIAPEQVTRLLQSCDQDRPTGQRDYTILLLLARLGLRPGEVVAMTLDDLDWEVGELNVRGKGGQRDRLPLPHDVGQALATYLSQVRPRCSTRRVFIGMRAPYRGFASSVAICTIVRRALERAELEPPCKGAHILRHSLATNLLHAGASMAEISDVLRHRQPQTTEIYAKVNRMALGELAQPWPGGER